jgi:phosphoadenosine phosphosulfate reductase
VTVLTLEKAETFDQRAERLLAAYGHLDGADLLRPMIQREFRGRIVLASSFGTEAAVTLGLVAEVDPATPAVFLDTGFLFGETLAYRDSLVKKLGLTNLRSIGPEDAGLDVANPSHALWNTDACCHLRKVLPMERALKGFDAWITGRKRIHGAGRAALPAIETEDGRFKINPLASWTQERIQAYFVERDLPKHPLEALGYPSVGCWPCTKKPEAGQGIRDGRWAGTEKTECGIHKAKWYRAGENI